jgi:hypothetical protein
MYGLEHDGAFSTGVLHCRRRGWSYGRIRRQAGRTRVGFEKPDSPVGIVLAQAGVFVRAQICGEYHARCIRIGCVVNPFIK